MSTVSYGGADVKLGMARLRQKYEANKRIIVERLRSLVFPPNSAGSSLGKNEAHGHRLRCNLFQPTYQMYKSFCSVVVTDTALFAAKPKVRDSYSILSNPTFTSSRVGVSLAPEVSLAIAISNA